MTHWASHFVSDIDGLTHLADDHYGAKINGGHPTMAFTRCGHVVTWDGVRADTGTYVLTSTALTCVRCAGGARDGRARRSALKNALFAEMYGTTPNMFGPHTRSDVAMTHALFNPRSILRRCARLATVLASKVMEVRRV